MGHLQVKSHLESDARRGSDIPLTNIIKDTWQTPRTPSSLPKGGDDKLPASLFTIMVKKKKKN